MFRMYAKDVDAAQSESINRIKEWANRCIGVRDGLVAESPYLAPSAMWEYTSLVGSYMLRMPPEDFGTLRLHTHHIENTRTILNEISIPQKFYESQYEDLRSGLPERYWVAAPQICGEWGHVIDGRLVNGRVIMMQEIIRSLWRSGELPRLEKIQRPVIFEIGAGFGWMANHLMTMYPNAVYIIVDLPETLLFSASYLTLLHGQDKVHLVEQDTEITADSLEDGSFVLVPHYLLPSLTSLHFDFAVNTYSFAEMTKNQVAKYLEFLAPRTDVLYSRNQETNVNQYAAADSTGEFSVTSLLRQLFDLEVLTPWRPAVGGKMGMKSVLRSYLGKVRNTIALALYFQTTRQGGGRVEGDGYLAVPKTNNNGTK